MYCFPLKKKMKERKKAETTCPPLPILKQWQQQKTQEPHPTTNLEVPGMDSFNNVSIISLYLITLGHKNCSALLSCLDQVHAE